MAKTDNSLSLDRGTDHAHHHLGHAGGHSHLTGALFFTLGFAFVEAVAGYFSGSLALLSDAGHMLTDSTALGLAALAAWLAKRPPSPRHTYGLVRLEILAALFNALLMFGLVAFIAVEAIDRFAQPRQVQGGVVTVVAVIGLLVNIGVAWQLSHGEKTLNTRAALLHVMGDMLGSVAALAAGLVIYFTGWMPIDPLLSLLVSGLILVSAWRLLGEALNVLLEAVPGHIDIERVAQDLAAIEGVAAVHDLHIWTLSSGKVALSAHMDVRDFADWPRIMAESRQRLITHHDIGHVTLQPELADSTAARPAHILHPVQH
ncbi:cobalt-zinc-cadmium efflux system protein [Sulfuritortus calidifontis]|uniref:Cobalt-zinc-cadmium efflux system protein n=1 Tax=Sulfuritortus calidifontis TaxID=1914471 RepID=A0A4V2UQZ8_9PROT|nr:cation diffusion facilitator family transporter [Sulfuritortus calidifontis]TCS73426.1 cobalt-zinc-cadmium efflux system protein [Sulfuritortus calidifontis]